MGNTNQKQFVVGPESEGAALGAVVRGGMELPWNAAKKLISSGRVEVDGVTEMDAGHRVRTGQTVAVKAHGVRAPSETDLPRDVIVHIDPHLIVVDKPSGISTVPYEEGERGTLVDRVRVLLNRTGRAPTNAPLFVVHRIDKETSGLVVFARTWVGKRHLAALFREHTIERSYLALANGIITRPKITFDTNLVENRGDGLRGSAKQSGIGVRAVTHVEVLGTANERASLLRCRLETGKTHQIRIHLAEAGHALIGERVYSRHHEGLIPAPRLMLHAATLAFTHPAQANEMMRFQRKPPRDFLDFSGELGFREELLASTKSSE